LGNFYLLKVSKKVRKRSCSEKEFRKIINIKNLIYYSKVLNINEEGRKMKIKLLESAVFFVLIFFACVGNLLASEILSWNDCVKETIENHPDLVSAVAKLDQTRADKKITQSSALPQISSDLTAKKSQVAGRDSAKSYSYSVTGKQLLFDGAKTSNSIKVARENIKADEYNYMVTSSSVRLSLKSAFAELLRAKELVLLTRSIVERRDQNFKLIELRYEAGREHKGSLLTSEADLVNAEFEVEQALRNLSLAQTKMAKALGRQSVETVEISGDFEVDVSFEVKPDFELLADETPFLKELIAKKDAAQFNLGSKKSDFFPEIYFNSSIGKSGSEWFPSDNESMFGLSVSFPLFEGGSRLAQVSKAKASIAEATAQEQSGRDGVIVILEETWSAYQDTLGTVFVQKKFLKAAEERAKIANSQYSSGLTSFDDWIIIEDNLVDAKKSYLNAQANVLIGEAQWIQARGGMLEYENEE